MMESQCEYFMYFPAVPISDLSDPARYRTLPRRSHLYLGETVRFLLVLRCKDVPSGGTPTDLLGKTFMWIENERMNLEYRHISLKASHCLGQLPVTSDINSRSQTKEDTHKQTC